MSGDDLFDGDDEGLGAYADAIGADLERRPEKATRGRPKGALNRKTQDFERWYQAKGFKDPLAALASFMTSDPVQLQSWFIEHERTVKAVGKKNQQAVPSLMDIIKEMHSVASVIAPYLHGKKQRSLKSSTNACHR